MRRPTPLRIVLVYSKEVNFRIILVLVKEVDPEFFSKKKKVILEGSYISLLLTQLKRCQMVAVQLVVGRRYPEGFCPSFDLGPIETADDNIEYVSTEDGSSFRKGHLRFRQENPILRFRQFPKNSTEVGLRETFMMFGSVKTLSINKMTHADKCSGVVRFFHVKDAERAMNSLKDRFEVYWLF